MVMKYNRALDYTTLALASARKGDTKRAAALFAKAASAPDAVRAIAILENSNKQAFAATAAAKAAAKKRVKAAEEFDTGDEEDLDGLIGKGDENEEEEEEEEHEVEGAVEEEGEEGFEKEFANVLASLVKQEVTKATAKPAKK